MNVVSKWFKTIFADAQVVLLISVVALLLITILLFGDMLAPAIAAIILAFLLDGPVNYLQRKGYHESISILIVFLAFLMLSAITFLAVVPPLLSQVADFINDSPAIIGRLRDGILDFQKEIPDLVTEQQVQTWFAGLGSEIANLGPKLLQYSLSGLTGAMTFAVYAVLVPVMVFFFMKDKKTILAWCASFLPKDHLIVEEVGLEIMQRAGDYARGKVYEIIIVATVAFITYQVIGLRYATLLAVITGLSVLIPYVGAASVTIPVALVAYFQWGISSEMAIAVIAYLILQAFDGNLLAPLLFSEVVKLHPNAIIIAILVFGGLWGFWGVFFAIPLATIANAIIKAWQARSNLRNTSEKTEGNTLS